MPSTDCWFIASIDDDNEMRILKRSTKADDYVDDPDCFLEHTLVEMSNDMPAGIYRLKIEAELLYEIPDGTP